MRRNVLSLFVASSVLVLCSNAFADADCQESGILEANGYGKIEVMPDTAVLSFSATASDMNSKEAKDKVEKQVSAFVRGVRGFGVDNEDIISDSISIMPRYEYVKDEPRKFTGYEAVRAVTVKVKDFTLIEKITQAAVDSKVSEVNGVYYELSDVTEVKKKADELAMKDAQDKASRLSKGFDVDLKKVCSLRFSGNAAPRANYKAQPVAMNAMASDSAAPEVYAPEKQVVESYVSVTYAID